MIIKQKTKRFDSCIMRNFLVADDREVNLTKWLLQLHKFIHLPAKKSRGKFDFRKAFSWSSNKVTNDLISCHLSPLPSASFFIPGFHMAPGSSSLCSHCGKLPAVPVLSCPWTTPIQVRERVFFGFTFFFFFLTALWDLSSLTRDQTWTMAVKALSYNHWTARKIPAFTVLKRSPELSVLTSPYQSL